MINEKPLFEETAKVNQNATKPKTKWVKRFTITTTALVTIGALGAGAYLLFRNK